MPTPQAGERLPAAQGRARGALVRSDLSLATRAFRFVQVRDVEIRHTPANDFSTGNQLPECMHGLRKRNRPAPVQQVEVKAIGAKAPQRILAGAMQRFSRSMVRIELAHEEYAVPAIGDRLRNDLLRAPFAIHLRRVDERHARRDSLTQRGNLARSLAAYLAHPPGAESEARYARTVGKQRLGNG